MMNFEEAMKYLRQGKMIFRKSSVGLGLQFEDGEVIHSFCIELFDLLADDWMVSDEE